MKRTEILQKLEDILRAAGGMDESAALDCTEDTKLLTDLGLTSVNMLFLVIAVEEEFGIQFDNVSVSDFETVGDVITYIEGKLA